MNCREFTEFLDDYVSDNIPAETRAKFEKHLAECPSCIAYLDSYRKTMHLEKAAFSGMEDPVLAEAPEELIQAILRARSF
jgi:anti-sigma factor RsiW